MIVYDHRERRSGAPRRLADEDDIRAVAGLGPKRARATAEAMRHEWADGRPLATP